MNKKIIRSRRFMASFILLALAGLLVLSACDGATVNFTYDPTTGAGSGNVVIATEAPAQDGGGDASGDPGAGGGNQNMNQVVLFGVVVALLIGTVAVVMASSRRRKVE